MNITIVGIDCATDPKKTGLAMGVIEGDHTVLSEVTTGARERPVDIVHEWVRERGPVLLAMDAPLGWPTDLGKTFASHIAGEWLAKDANDLFRRATDKFVTREVGKRPLDVGADRIARTAHAALDFLNELRGLTGLGIPLAWNPKLSERVEVIEVYPAGTLSALRIQENRYKKPEDGKSREKILLGLEEKIEVSTALRERLIGNADLLDATVCVLAGRDFLDGEVVAPESLDLAKKEGWIWVRPPIGHG